MRYQKERTKATTTPSPCYNAEECDKLNLHECDEENIYWPKINLFVVINQESKLFPRSSRKQRNSL